MIISTAMVGIDVVRAVHPLPLVGGDVVNLWTMSTKLIVAGMEAEAIIVGDDRDRIHHPLHLPALPPLHLVRKAVIATIDVDLRGDGEDDPLLMIVLLVEETVGAAEVVETIGVATITVEKAKVQVAVGGGEGADLLLVLALHRGKVQGEIMVAVAIVETVTTVAAVDAIATEVRRRQRKRNRRKTKILQSVRMVREV